MSYLKQIDHAITKPSNIAIVTTNVASVIPKFRHFQYFYSDTVQTMAHLLFLSIRYASSPLPTIIAVLHYA